MGKLRKALAEPHPVIIDNEAASKLTMRDYYDFIYRAKPGAPTG